MTETGGRSSMTGAHRLHRFALAAIRSAPQSPVFFIRNRIARFPKIRSDPAVSAILQQPATLAALDLVSDLGTELKIQAHVVDTPGAIRLHENPVVGIGDDVFEFPVSCFNRYIG